MVTGSMLVCLWIDPANADRPAVEAQLDLLLSIRVCDLRTSRWHVADDGEDPSILRGQIWLRRDLSVALLPLLELS